MAPTTWEQTSTPTLRPVLWQFVTRRLAASVLTLFAVLVIVFFVFQVLGDPARRTLPVNASEQQVQDYSAAHGFDDPVLERFWRYISSAVRLDFGQSTSVDLPAIDVVLDALPRSLLLAFASFLVTALLGVGLGTVAGLSEGSRLDRFLQSAGAVASSIPEFWSGLVLIILLAVQVPVFPTGGSGGINYLVLPAVAMAIPPMGRLMYVVRESVRATMQEPYVLVARSKGLSGQMLLFGHILRGAIVPIIALGGLELTRMSIGGVVVIESVFAWPGIGQLYVEAMKRYDLALVSATLFMATAVVLVLNTVLDLLYTRLDPRIEMGNH